MTLHPVRPARFTPLQGHSHARIHARSGTHVLQHLKCVIYVARHAHVPALLPAHVPYVTRILTYVPSEAWSIESPAQRPQSVIPCGYRPHDPASLDIDFVAPGSFVRTSGRTIFGSQVLRPVLA